MRRFRKLGWNYSSAITTFYQSKRRDFYEMHRVDMAKKQHQNVSRQIELCKKADIDFDVPHEVKIDLAFPSRVTTELVWKFLTDRGLAAEKVEIATPWWKRLVARKKWRVTVSVDTILESGRLEQIASLFENIATGYNGSFQRMRILALERPNNEDSQGPSLPT